MLFKIPVPAFVTTNQRFILSLFGLLLLASALCWRFEMFRDYAGRDDENRSNSASMDMLNLAEFAAIFSIGASLAFFWHCFYWNSPTRQISKALLLGTLTVQVVALGYYIGCATDFDKPRGLSADLAPVVMQAGVAAILAIALSAVILLFEQLLTSGYEAASDVRTGGSCTWQNDCCTTGDTFVGPCSLGRLIVVLAVLSSGAIVVIRASVAAELVQDYITSLEDPSLAAPHGNIYALVMTQIIVYVSGMVYGVLLFQLVHVLFAWNVNSKTISVVMCFVAIAFETWAFGYVISYWLEGDDKLLESPRDVTLFTSQTVNKRFSVISSLTLIAFVLQLIVCYFLSVFDANLSVAKASSGRCLGRLPRLPTAVIVFSIAALCAGLYVARGAIAGKVLIDQYDNEQDSIRGRQAERISTNTATYFFVPANNMNVGIGCGLALFALERCLALWTKSVQYALLAAALLAFGFDLVSIGYAAKQQKIDGDVSADREIDKNYTAAGSLAIISPWFSALLALAVLFLIKCSPSDDESAAAPATDEEFTSTEADTETEETDTYTDDE